MAITFDNAVGAHSIGTALQFTLTATAGAAALVVFNYSDVGNSASAVAYAGVAMTKLGRIDSLECWGLLNPTAGANILSAQFVALGNWTLVGATYMNVASFGGLGSASAAAATTVNFSVSSGAGNVVIAAFGIHTGNTITLNNGTLRNTTSFGPVSNLVIADIAGAATVSLSATAAAGENWLMLGLNMVVVSTVTNTFTFAMLGVGS